MSGSMVNYECRCECAYDFEKFAETAGISMLYDAEVVRAPDDADAVEKMICLAAPRIKFKSKKTLDELLIIAFQQDDAHVLFQTLELEENYTGDRKWDREIPSLAPNDESMVFMVDMELPAWIDRSRLPRSLATAAAELEELREQRFGDNINQGEAFAE